MGSHLFILNVVFRFLLEVAVDIKELAIVEWR